ncbi:MAG: hypothetical protein IJR70_08385 [Eubacterium sp.]|nr:hypothetical protein [Eubacterium sp.]
MDFFKQWSFCVCLTLIISVVFSVLSPSGEMKRFYKITIAVFIFISFIYPLKDFDTKDININSGQQIFEINENSNKGYENEINRKIKDFLKSKKIPANVSSEVSFNLENSEIEIKDVVITIPDGFNKDDVKSLVFDEMGINSKVICIGE